MPSTIGNVKIPEGMLKAAMYDDGAGYLSEAWMERRLEAALRWLSENPIVPTDKQLEDIASFASAPTHFGVSIWFQQWQRRMFLAPESKIPEEVKDLLWESSARLDRGFHWNDAILEAYRRGQNSKEKP